jgi:hypothetical protein
MKIYLTILLMCIVYTTHAQFKMDENGDIIPLSMLEENKQYIDWGMVKTINLGEYNNDSLFIVYNGRPMEEGGSQVRGNLVFDTLLDFKKEATRFKIPGGRLYIMIIESNTAAGLCAVINSFELKKGCYFSYRSDSTSYFIDSPSTYLYNNKRINNGKPFFTDVTAKRLILEYFEPRSVRNVPSITIYKLWYRFDGLWQKKNSTYQINSLKSGGHGTAVNNCQEDIACYTDYNDLAAPVCYIEVHDANGNYYSKGTGVLLNKAEGYQETDKPVILTAGHLFTIRENGIICDISQSGTIQAWIKYTNSTCNGTSVESGISIKGADLVTLGSSFKTDRNSNLYREEEDYAVLQTTKDFAWLNNLGARYAGWTSTSINGYDEGYTAIGHPNGDVQKVLIDNDATTAYLSAYFPLKFDVGVNETGFSGSPVYNSNKKLVGWICTAETGSSCSNIGQMQTTCGYFRYAYWEALSDYIDPAGIGSCDFYVPAELPTHCTDCVKDGNETNIDCGGDCLPCTDTKKSETIELEFQGGTVYAKENIAVLAYYNGDKSILPVYTTIPSNTSLNAGLSVTIDGDVLIQKDVEMDVDNFYITNSPARGCQPPCIAASNRFTPNGDGIDDYFVIWQSFVTEYDLYIFGSSCTCDGQLLGGNKVVYEEYGIPVTENGMIIAWDGSRNCHCYLEVYYYLITYWDCYGNRQEITGFIHIFDGKKSDETTGSLSEDEYSEDLIIFPNPTNNMLNITLPNNEVNAQINIYNESGKSIFSKITDQKTNTIDLSNIESGVYFVEVKINDSKNYIKKFVKQ